jgi:TPR repeat protein
MKSFHLLAVIILAAFLHSVSSAEWYDSERLDGSPSAMASHGLALCKGDGVVKNELEGLAWLEAARQIKDVLRPSSSFSLSAISYTPDTLAATCAEVSKGMSEDQLARVKKQTQEILSETYDSGCSFARPEATTYASLLLLSSPKQDDKILGLALLYAGSKWFADVSPSEITNAPAPYYSAPATNTVSRKGWNVDPDYAVDYSALIARTEVELGKSDSIKAQELAGKIYDNLRRDDAIARSVAVLKALNPARGEAEEQRVRLAHEKANEEFMKAMTGGASSGTDSKKSWVDKVGDFFGGGE